MSGGSGLSDDHPDELPRDAGRVIKEIQNAKLEFAEAKRAKEEAVRNLNSIECRLSNLQIELTKLVISDLDLATIDRQYPRR